MKRIIRSIVSAGAGLALILGAGGCQSASRTSIEDATKQWTKQTEQLLSNAGDRLGVPVQTTQMVHYAQWGASFYTAAAAKLDTVPAGELRNGVDIGVVYVDSPGQTFPKGYYRLRGIADARQPGDLQGTIQVIGTDGTVASEIPAEFSVSSMERPVAAPLSTDISVAALPCTKPPFTINCFHRTTFTNATWRVSTTGLVVPAPVTPVDPVP
jgi:hypothetical protein